MADYNITIKVTKTGLDKTITSLHKLDDISSKAVKPITNLKTALLSLANVNLTELNVLFKTMVSSANELNLNTKLISNDTKEIVKTTKELNNNFNATTESIKIISNNTEGVVKHLDSATHQASELGNALSGVDSLINLSQTVSNWTKGIITGSLQARSELQMFERQLSAVMGGAEKAKAVLPSIKEMANTTVNIDTEGAISAVTTFMRMGDTIDKATEKTKLLANATAYFGGTTDNVKMALIQLQQAASRESGWYADLAQLRNHISGITQLVEQHFGKSIQELQKLGFTGKQIVAGAIEEMKKLPLVDGGLDEKFSALESSIKDIKSEMGEALMPAFELFTNTIGKVSDAIKSLPKGVKEFGATALVFGTVTSSVILGAAAFGQLALVFKNGIGQLIQLKEKGLELVGVKKKEKIAIEEVSVASARESELMRQSINEYLKQKEVVNETNLAVQKAQKGTFAYMEAKARDTIETNKLAQAEARLNAIRNSGTAITENRTAAENDLTNSKSTGGIADGLGDTSIGGVGKMKKTFDWLKKGNAKRKLGKLGGKAFGGLKGFGLMALLGVGGDLISGIGEKQLAEQEKKGLTGDVLKDSAISRKAGISKIIGNALSGASMGAIAGPWGMLAGGIGGAIYGGVSANNKSNEIIKQSQETVIDKFFDKKVNGYSGRGDERNAELADAKRNYKKDLIGLDISKEKDREKILEISKDYKATVNDINKKYDEQAKKKSEELAKVNKEKAIKQQEFNTQMAIINAKKKGNEFEAKSLELNLQLNKVLNDAKATENDKTLAKATYDLNMHELKKDEEEKKKKEAEQKRKEQEDAKLQAIQKRNKSIADSRNLQSAQLELQGNSLGAKNIQSLSSYEQVRNDPTKSLTEKWTAYYKYLNEMNNNQTNELKRQVDIQKKGIDELISKRKEQTSNIIAEIEKERNAKMNYSEMGGQAVLTSGYFDTSLSPESFTNEEIQTAARKIDMRKQIEENKNQQVDFAINGNTTNELKQQQQNIENMNKYIQDNNVTGQSLLTIMKNLFMQVQNVNGILTNANNKVMA